MVYNGVDVDKYQQMPDRQRARQRFRLPLDASVAGFVGRLDCGNKGAREFLELASKMPTCWHWLLAGDGRERAHYEQLARQRQIDQRARFAGAITDVRWAYGAMDVLVLVSRGEAFGLVALEAMAANVPVVALECPGGLSEVLRGSGAITIPGRDIDRMARELCALWASPEKLEQMRRRGKEHVMQRFSLRTQVEALRGIYDKLLKGRR